MIYLKSLEVYMRHLPLIYTLTLLVSCHVLIACGSEQSSESTEVELSQGPEDVTSRLGCTLIMGEMSAVTPVSDRSDAGQVTLLPNNDMAYEVMLPESGVGYLTLEVPDWDITVSMLTRSENTVKVFDMMGEIEIEEPLSWSASCDDFTEERLHFHSWGAYVMEITGEPQSKVKLSLVKKD